MKKMLVSFAKRFLPQKIKSKLKVLIASNPYLFNPVGLLRKQRDIEELNKILDREKDAKGIIICPPTIDWHTSLYQRPHQIARAFAKEGYLVFYCTNNLRFDNVKGFEKVEDKLYLSSNTAILRKIAEEAYILISWAINRFYADRFKGSKVIYEYMDELDVFDGDPRELKSDHRWLVENADLVVATADSLFAEVIKVAKKAILVPNGVDVNHFKQKTKTPKDLAGILSQKKPLIGYYGALAEWFDYKLLFEAARERPNYNFVMIGPLDYDKSFLAVKSIVPENVYFLGPKKYEVLPLYGSCFNIATIPFKINSITKSTSPIKLFEYMALKKPIVTTDLPECRKYKSVLVSKNTAEFINNLDRALKLQKDESYLKIETKEADENSWQNRVREIEKYMV